MSLPETLVKLINSTIGTPKRGLEIGVYKGHTSMALVEAFPNCHMDLVDPWKEWTVDDSYWGHKRTGKFDQTEWDKIFAAAVRNVPKGSNATFYRMTSRDFCRLFPANVFDFVFIDGDHSFKHVRADIKRWRTRIRPGGLICGHDYGGAYRGVKRAITRAFGDGSVMVRPDRVWGKILDEND